MVASCNEPLGMPSFSVAMRILTAALKDCATRWKLSKETRAFTCVTHVAVAEPRDEHQQSVVITVDEDAIDLQAIPRRLPLRPQLVTRAAEERRIAALDGAIECLLIHEADHQHFPR